LGLNAARAAAGDLSPLQGCWEATFSDISPNCRGFRAAMCFNERGQGQMVVDHRAGPIQAQIQAAYESGQLVINSAMGHNADASFVIGRFRIKCALRGEEADCVYDTSDASCESGAGLPPVTLKRR
jgi:hypothetical protein